MAFSTNRAKPVTDEENAQIRRVATSDTDARELTDAELDELRPTQEMLPMIFGQENAEQLVHQRGRPASANTKELVSVRYDRDVLEAFRASREGW